MPGMRVVILDDHSAVGSALGLLLAPRFEVVGILHDWMHLVPFLQKNPADFALVDGTLPHCDISHLIQRTEKLARVIVMTMYPAPSSWPGLRRMGATGIVSKSLPPEDFVAEVERLALFERPTSDGERDARVPEPTSRQLEILICMAAGLETKEIAAACGLSPGRTSELIAEVLHLTRTRSWAAAVLVAVELGWIEQRFPPPPPDWKLPRTKRPSELAPERPSQLEDLSS